ncbi:acyltransferase [Marinilongibacter aquaticus]|uniref:acyltransferase family protein n=1 Tax=Marinilongibacter aquaticus TaxID=2975157 RepID=UPI0021BDE993|nr:acyltransferase [Marinilongibacter aquaticus]UBM59676.1 acyltransferase [Marinilongibacter aquaticus]
MRLTKLDGLRGLFSLMVVFYHYPQNQIPESLAQFFLFRQSYVFVDFFFCLSGFVISYNYHTLHKWSEFTVYMVKRFIRLYPSLFLAVSVYFFGYLFVGLPTDDKAPLINFLETALMTNSTPLLGTNPGFNEASWSISSEMVSYLVIGLTFLIFPKRRTVPVLLTILLAYFILFRSGQFFHTFEYGFLRGLVSFNLGFVVWKLSKYDFKANNYLEFLIPILLIVLLYFVHNFTRVNEMETPSGALFNMLVIPLFFASSILLLLKTDGPVSHFLDTKPVQYLGKISYSIYINQGFMFHLAIIAFSKIYKVETTADMLVQLFFVVSMILLVSHFTNKYVEVKLGRYLKQKALGKPRLAKSKTTV